MPRSPDSSAEPSHRRVLATMIAAAVLLGAVLVVFLQPWGPKMIDLDVYRAAASALLHGSDPYSAHGPDGLPFTYPIFAALVFVPFAVLPTVAARVAITLLSFGALWVICHLTLRQVLPDRSRRQLAVWSVPVAVLAVSTHPVLDTLLFGQVNLVLVAMVLVDMFLVRGRGRGVLVGLATGIKLTPGLFLIYFLVTGQRRAARTAALTAALTVAAGFALRPRGAWAFWTRYVLDPARTGNVTYAGNQSVLAITARLLRRITPPPALTWSLVAIVVVAALVIARRRYRAGDELTAVSVVGVAALLASPISWTHHWVWFIPVLAVVAAWAHRTRPDDRPWWRLPRWWVLGVATLVVWSGPMRFTPKNGLRELTQTPPQQLVANSFGLLAVLFLGWAGWLAYHRLPAATPVPVTTLVGSGGRGDGGRADAAGRAGRGAAGGAGRRGRVGDDVDHEPQRAGRVTGGLVGVGEAARNVELDPAADLGAD